MGYELYMPTEFSAHVFDQIAEAGADFGLRMAASSRSIRCGWKKVTGTGATTLAKRIRPIRRASVLPWRRQARRFHRTRGPAASETSGPQRRMVQVRLPGRDAPRCLSQRTHSEGGKIVGSVTTGALGHRIGASLAMGYVTDTGGVKTPGFHRTWRSRSRGSAILQRSSCSPGTTQG